MANHPNINAVLEQLLDSSDCRALRLPFVSTCDA
jgi:hypothetical protein